MVCIPCIVVPLFLYIWHKFLQPFVLKFWNPWGPVKDAAAVDTKDGSKEPNGCPASNGSVTTGMSCPFSGKEKEKEKEAITTEGEGEADKKND